MNDFQKNFQKRFQRFVSNAKTVTILVSKITFTAFKYARVRVTNRVKTVVRQVLEANT